MMAQLQQAQQMMGKEAKRLQEQLAEAEYEGFDEEELVRVTMNGKQQPIRTDITDDAMNVGPEKLGELVQEAHKDAYDKSQAAMKEEMMALSKKLGLPTGLQGGDMGF